MFRGFVPTTVRDLAWLQALFSGQEYVSQKMKTHIPCSERTRNLSASAIVGAVAGGATNPADMLKTRMQVTVGENLPKMTEVIKTIVQKEGVTAFTKGMAARSLLCSGAMVLICEAKKWLPQWYPDALHK